MYTIILMFESHEKSWEQFETKEDAIKFYRYAVTDDDVIKIDIIQGKFFNYLSQEDERLEYIDTITRLEE